VIELSTTSAEGVVTGLVYLGITSVDSVYSGLMIDGGRISFGIRLMDLLCFYISS